MTLGSLPLWVSLVVITRPPLPGTSQIINTLFVALSSGVFATGIFLYARNKASNSNEIASVDATQASEVVFALIGGITFLGSELPNIISVLGLVLILVGLTLFAIIPKT